MTPDPIITATMTVHRKDGTVETRDVELDEPSRRRFLKLHKEQLP